MVSYAITVYNEINEIRKLVSQLKEYISEDDEIVIQMDKKATKEVREFVTSLENIIYCECALNNNFAMFKNCLNEHCTKEWIFQIDADETVNPILIINLHQILEINKNIDVILVPRINTVEGMTQEDINRYRWNINEHNWVNFPDYQFRLFKNKPEIKWDKPVHEQLIGYQSISKLPPHEEYCLKHPKTIDRQRKQNEFYRKMFN